MHWLDHYFSGLSSYGTGSLLLLWRSLRRRPDLGRLTDELAIWITLTEQSVALRMENAVEELGSSGLSDDRDLYRFSCHHRHRSNDPDIPQHIVFDILCRTPHLSTFSLQVPRTAEDSRYTYLMRMIASATSARPVASSHDPPVGVSRSLSTLQLCLDPCLPVALKSRTDEEEDMGFDHQDYSPLFSLSSLVRLSC